MPRRERQWLVQAGCSSDVLQLSWRTTIRPLLPARVTAWNCSCRSASRSRPTHGDFRKSATARGSAWLSKAPQALVASVSFRVQKQHATCPRRKE